MFPSVMRSPTCRSAISTASRPATVSGRTVARAHPGAAASTLAERQGGQHRNVQTHDRAHNRTDAPSSHAESAAQRARAHKAARSSSSMQCTVTTPAVSSACAGAAVSSAQACCSAESVPESSRLPPCACTTPAAHQRGASRWPSDAHAPRVPSPYAATARQASKAHEQLRRATASSSSSGSGSKLAAADVQQTCGRHAVGVQQQMQHTCGGHAAAHMQHTCGGRAAASAHLLCAVHRHRAPARWRRQLQRAVALPGQTGAYPRMNGSRPHPPCKAHQARCGQSRQHMLTGAGQASGNNERVCHHLRRRHVGMWCCTAVAA